MILREISKYPYYCNEIDQSKIFLSDKIVQFTINKSSSLIVSLKAKNQKILNTKIFAITFILIILSSDVKPASSVTLSFPPQKNQIELLQQSTCHKMEEAPFISKKSEKVRFDVISSREAFPLIYINSKM